MTDGDTLNIGDGIHGSRRAFKRNARSGLLVLVTSYPVLPPMIVSCLAMTFVHFVAKVFNSTVLSLYWNDAGCWFPDTGF